MLAAQLIIGLSLLVLAYAVVGYPLALIVLRAVGVRRRRRAWRFESWPSVTITVPVYNEEAQIADTLESLLRIRYPHDLHILIVSDASSDGTDGIVRAYADRGIELYRIPKRVGKTEAENQAREKIRGDIVVNTDASIRVHPDAVERLVEQFADPEVGVATGRDVSLGGMDMDSNVGESGYVGMEMWVRDLETRVTGLIGASGSLYAIRRDLHDYTLPAGLSRDFSAALVSRLAGYRTVSVPDALCAVPRTPSITKEYRRKVRTVTRGLNTLWYFRELLNPLRHGLFSWMLWSHKIARWLMPICLLGILLGLAILAPGSRLAAGVLALVAAAATAGGITWLRAERGGRIPKAISILAYGLASNVAVARSWVRALAGRHNPIWEPTRR